MVLLFKSVPAWGKPRSKDQADFERVMSHGLDPECEAWLRRALGSYRPEHPWLESLA